MLWAGAIAIGIVMGSIAYGWLFAKRPPRERLAYAVVVAVLTPVILFAVVVALVAISFM